MIGIVGKKCGMTRVFTDDGRSVPVTIVQANPNFINKIKTKNTDGYDAIQVTTGQKIKKLSKPNQGQIKSTKKEHSSKLHEFRLNNHEIDKVETGKEITVDYFQKGELVDISGKTIGKGFAGVIKRHNFSMQDATHGNSLSHRAPGSIGQNQTPGRVFKGKKMSGHMGNVKRTIQNLEVVEIDSERNLIYIKGSCTGHDNSYLVITPSIKSKQEEREIFPQFDLEETPETAAQPEETEVEAQPEETPETAAQPEETEVEAQPEETEVEAQPEETPETDSVGEDEKKKDK